MQNSRSLKEAFDFYNVSTETFSPLTNKLTN